MDEKLKQKLKDHIDSLKPKEIAEIKYSECGICLDPKECGKTTLENCKRKLRKHLKDGLS
ncbi:MAG: hypothetical protein K0R00_5 [Herbinix sp.]|jgi:hypothetical protein|nr:hypothetical protein [Herbinix sp.]